MAPEGRTGAFIMSCIMVERSFGIQLLVWDWRASPRSYLHPLTCASVSGITPGRGADAEYVSNQVLRHERVYVTTEAT